MRVLVVGTGVIGLTCALKLREQGHAVEVVADKPPSQTTSAVAAAVWSPYLALPIESVTRWAARSFDEFAALALEPETGVVVRTGMQLFREPTPDPWWRAAVPDLVRPPANELPAGFRDAYEITVPTIDMPYYLSWLVARLAERGVQPREARIDTLGQPECDVVVNCSGLGARKLADDASVFAVRGQVIVVEQIGLERWFIDESEGEALTYVIPRRDTIILGGTALPNDDDIEVRQTTADQIMARCLSLVPALESARVLAHRVGLRPARPTVRLELDLTRDSPVVHCYGHGGAGVTLSYGCAEDVVAIVDSL